MLELKQFLAFCGLFLCARIAFATPEQSPALFQGLTLPQKVVESPEKFARKGGLPIAGILRCSLFPNVIFLEEDTGLVGSDHIYLRERSPKVEDSKLCSSKELECSQEISVNEHQVLGVVGNVLVTRSADGFGEERELRFFELASKHEIGVVQYQETAPVKFTQKGESLELEYFARVRLYCDLSAEGSKCWEATRKLNQIPKLAKLKKPNCQAAFKNPEFKKNPKLRHEPRALQLFAKVHVDDLQKSEKHFYNDLVACVAAP